MTIIYPEEHLKILPYNRVVKDLSGISPENVLEGIAYFTEMTKMEEGESTVPLTGDPEFCLLMGRGSNQWYRCRIKPDFIEPNDPVKCLVTNSITDHFFGRVLGVENIRTDPRIGFVGGIRGVEELEKLVKEGKAELAISLAPVRASQVFNVADAGLMMPPKCTWYEPKPRSGFIMRCFED